MDKTILRNSSIEKIYSCIESVYKNNIADAINIFADETTNIINNSEIYGDYIIQINEIIKEIFNAVNKRDYVLFADLLEFELVPYIENIIS